MLAGMVAAVVIVASPTPAGAVLLDLLWWIRRN